jgi:preprotein translocase subunit SecF
MNKEKLSQFYDKNYKKILIIPALLIIISLVYLSYFYSQNGDIIYKDVSLTGGTAISVDSNLSISEVQGKLIDKFPNIAISSVSDNSGKQIKLTIIVPDEPDKIKPELEKVLGIKLTDKNSSIEFTGSSLSNDFYTQLLKAIVFAFLLMALVVFLVFGQSKRIKVYCIILTLVSTRLTFPSSKFLNGIVILGILIFFIYSLIISKEKKFYIYSGVILLASILLFAFPVYFLILPLSIALFLIYMTVSVPSMAVISCVFADIMLPLAVINLMGMKISSAGIVAFLMLIGYSVDTDILLTTRVLNRKQDSVNEAIWGAFKTGSMMTLTAIASVAVGLIVVYSFQSILNQIFTILIIGLIFDLFNTWITNTSLIKWYVERAGR